MWGLIYETIYRPAQLIDSIRIIRESQIKICQSYLQGRVILRSTSLLKTLNSLNMQKLTKDFLSTLAMFLLPKRLSINLELTEIFLEEVNL